MAEQEAKGGVNMPPEDIDMEYQEQMSDEERELEEEMKDWVRVVRCKDCKKRNTRTCMMNNNVGMNKDLFDDDYCSYGERKDG